MCPGTFNLWVTAERMRDCAPAHFIRAMRDILSNTDHERWIGRGGPLHGLHASFRLRILWIFTCGDTIKPLYLQPLLTTKRHIALWMPVRVSATTPVSLHGCGGPSWDMSRRALNLVEDILSTYYKRNISAITHKSNVSGHILMWKFFLVWYLELKTQSLSAPFSYELYIYIYNRRFCLKWRVAENKLWKNVFLLYRHPREVFNFIVTCIS
jgi:hypothetical protein